jgi:6-phospho-beta-glucosidase
VVLGHAEIIEEVNPDATFINVTNPIGLVVEALVRYSKLKVLGVDDQPGTYIRKVATLLQTPPERMRVDYVGLNHLGWIQDVKVDGRSRMSFLLDLLEKQPEDGFDYDLIELFRMIPTRATGLYFHRGEVLKKQKACSRFRSEILHEAEKQILALYKDEHLVDLPDLTRQRNAVWYEETVLPLVEALESAEEKDFVLCVRNGDCIRDLPDDSSVEVPVAISSAGARPRRVGSLPRFLKGAFLAAKESDRLTVEAVRHRSYEYALQALTVNPFVPSFEVAKSFLERMIRDEKLQLH